MFGMTTAIHEKTFPTSFPQEDAITLKAMLVGLVEPVWSDAEFDEKLRPGRDILKYRFNDPIFIIL